MGKKISNIKFYRQIGPHCITASICSILNFYGHEVLPGAIAWQMIADGIHQKNKGVDLSRILLYIIKEWQMAVYPFVSHFNNTIRDFINNNIPLLVIQKLNNDSETLHSRIVFGYNNTSEIYLLDPAKGEIRISVKEFESLSAERGFPLQNIYLLVIPQSRDHYKQFFEKNPFYLNIMGTIKEMAGEDAEAYYKESIRLAPGYADPYNNLALLYLKKNDLSKAKLWAALALELAPDEYSYQETFKKVSNL